MADLAVLSEDYFAVEEDAIRGIESVLIVVEGKLVHGSDEFASLAPELPAVSPDWSTVSRFGGYCNSHPTAPRGVYAHPEDVSSHHWFS